MAPIGHHAPIAAQRDHELQQEAHQRRQRIEQWAREVMADPDSVVLDLETTGLAEGGPDYAVEAAVLAMDGTVLLQTLLDPQHDISEGAAAVHGITAAELHDAPTWEQTLPELEAVLQGRRIVIYHAAFDTKIMRCEMHRLYADQDPGTDQREAERRATAWVDALRVECAMLQYAEWYGEPSSRGGYRRQPLDAPPELAHRAAGDCTALIRRIRFLANPREFAISEGASVGNLRMNRVPDDYSGLGCRRGAELAGR